MFRFIRTAVVATVALTATAPAFAAVNLLTNGSFEIYTAPVASVAASGCVPLTNFCSTPATPGTPGSFAGWTTVYTSGSNPPQEPVQSTTDGRTAGKSSDVVAADNARPTGSPDAVGTNAVFFIADNANQSLTQAITLISGQTYEVGFDLFKTPTGSSNTGTFTVAGKIGNTSIVTASSTTLATGSWVHYAATFVASTTSTTFALNFLSGNTPAADVLVDLAYVTAVNAVTAVPEPASLALLAVGAFGLAMVRRRFV